MLVNQTYTILKWNWKCSFTVHTSYLIMSLECHKSCASRHVARDQVNVMCCWWCHASLLGSHLCGSGLTAEDTLIGKLILEIQLYWRAWNNWKKCKVRSCDVSRNAHDMRFGPLAVASAHDSRSYSFQTQTFHHHDLHRVLPHQADTLD